MSHVGKGLSLCESAVRLGGDAWCNRTRSSYCCSRNRGNHRRRQRQGLFTKASIEIPRRPDLSMPYRSSIHENPPHLLVV
jgi:hypothetical protein